MSSVFVGRDARAQMGTSWHQSAGKRGTHGAVGRHSFCPPGAAPPNSCGGGAPLSLPLRGGRPLWFPCLSFCFCPFLLRQVAFPATRATASPRQRTTSQSSRKFQVKDPDAERHGGVAPLGACPLAPVLTPALPDASCRHRHFPFSSLCAAERGRRAGRQVIQSRPRAAQQWWRIEGAPLQAHAHVVFWSRRKRPIARRCRGGTGTALGCRPGSRPGSLFRRSPRDPGPRAGL